MDPISLFFHFLGFTAPALAVAVGVALAGRWLIGSPAGLGLRLQAVVNLLVGIAVLAAGLWTFGVDGKMASYAALVAAVGTAQWLGSRAWKG